MTETGSALALARAEVAAARDDPRGRLGLITRTYHGPTGRAPQHLPFRRAALSFMRWQAQRGVLKFARRVATRQRVVAGGKRATVAGHLRSGRARRRSGRGALVAARAART